MVNAIRVAARFIDRLPTAELSPETTDGYEGFVHPYQLEASVDRTRVKVLIRDFVTAALAGEGGAGRTARARGGRRHARRDARDPGRRVLPQHARGARPPSPGGRARPRGDPARRARADREADPRRHRRVTAVVHGPADAQPLRRRAQLSLPAGVGVGAGHGEGGGGDRESGARVGGARAGDRSENPVKGARDKSGAVHRQLRICLTGA